MAVILLVVGLSLLMQGSLCSPGQTEGGCKKWRQAGDNVCCDACHPGHRLVSECGPRPSELCTLCEAKTFTVQPKNYRCTPCTQCVGAQVQLKECTATTDTKCGCREGLTCGNDRCSFCVEKCNIGQEPTENRSCRPCPHGTFNDQIHQMCKPWSINCPNPNQEIITKGDAFNDIKCVSAETVTKPEQPEQAQPLVLYIPISLFLLAVCIIIIIIIIIMAIKIHQKRKKTKKTITKTQIIRTPTDDPRTLIAIECSFHEAQQEQGSSSESLASKESSKQLIG